MNNNLIKTLPHQPIPPLSIEREWNNGYEKIIIEGVVYDAEYFRTFAHPDTDVLYAVKKDAEGVVCLTIIPTAEEAKQFFEEIGQGDPAPTEKQHAV